MNAAGKLYREAARAYLAGDRVTSRAIYAACRDRQGVGQKAKAVARRKFEAAVKRQAEYNRRQAIHAANMARFDSFDPSI